MLFLLYGPDHYRLSQKTNEIIESYSASKGYPLDCVHIDLFYQKEEDFWGVVSQQSIFDRPKIIIVENILHNIQWQKTVQKHLSQLASASHIFIFIEKKEITSRNTFFEALKKDSQTYYFEALKGLALHNWIKSQFERYGVGVEPRATQKLVDYVGQDTWALANEIQKLAAFKQKKQNVTVADIEKLVLPTPEAEIFKTIDYFAAGKKDLALTSLQQHLMSGENPLYLLTMMTYQMRNLLFIKTKPLLGPAGLGIKPFVFKKAFALAQRFSVAQLKNIYNSFLKADLQIKTSQDDARQVIKSLVVFPAHDTNTSNAL